MRTVHFALMALLLAAGCQQPRPSPKSPEQSASPEDALNHMVETPLENSPTFQKLKHRAKDWDFSGYDPTNAWVTVDVSSISEDGNFSHRWATLEVQTNSGVILKEGEDENGELGWFPEFLPTIPPINIEFPGYRETIFQIQQRVGTVKTRVIRN